MDRSGDRGTAADGDLLLPSRAAALEICRRTLEAAEEPGPVLLTGEAGAGKTWLWGQLVARCPGGRRWLAVDLAPTAGPVEFAQSLALGLGLGPVGPGRARAAVAEALAEAADEGRRWGLIVDEAHNADPEMLEELRLLSNRLGRPDGFDALLLVGQTGLARRLSTRPLAALEARLAARVHLRPIDADEARELLAHRFPRHAWTAKDADHLHRDEVGNPRRLLRIAAALATRPVPSPSAPAPDREGLPRPVSPRLGTPKPPLRVEEGLIEVGWEGDDSEPSAEPVAAEVDRSVRIEWAADEPDDEVIHDPYAALQAWTEWSENQGRGRVRTEEGSAARLALSDAADPAPPGPSTRLWADEPQGFAPYSQLFSRLKQFESEKA